MVWIREAGCKAHIERKRGEQGGTNGCCWGRGADFVVRVRVVVGRTDDRGAEDQQGGKTFLMRGKFEGQESFGKVFRVGIRKGKGVVCIFGSRA